MADQKKAVQQTHEALEQFDKLVEKAKKADKKDKQVSEKDVVVETDEGQKKVGSVKGFQTRGKVDKRGGSGTTSKDKKQKTTEADQTASVEDITQQAQRQRERAAETKRGIEQARQKIQQQRQKAKQMNPEQYDFFVPAEKDVSADSGRAKKKVSYDEYQQYLRQRSEDLYEAKQKSEKRIKELAPVARGQASILDAKEKPTTVRGKVQQAVEKEARLAGQDPDEFFVGKPEKVDTKQERQLLKQLKQDRQERQREKKYRTRAEVAKANIKEYERMSGKIKRSKAFKMGGEELSKEEMVQRIKAMPGEEVVLGGEEMPKQEAIEQIKSYQPKFTLTLDGKQQELTRQEALSKIDKKQTEAQVLVAKRRSTPIGRISLGEASQTERLVYGSAANIVAPRGYKVFTSAIPGGATPTEVSRQIAEETQRNIDKYGVAEGMARRSVGSLTSPAGLPVTAAVAGGAVSGGVSAISSASSTAGAVAGGAAKAAGGLLVGREIGKGYQDIQEGDYEQAAARGLALGTAVGGAYAGSKALGPKFAKGYKAAGRAAKKLPSSTSKGMFQTDLKRTIKAPKGKTSPTRSKIVKKGGKVSYQADLPHTVRFFRGGYRGGGTREMLRKLMWEKRTGLKQTQTKPQSLTKDSFKKVSTGGGQKQLLKQKAKTKQRVKLEDPVTKSRAKDLTAQAFETSQQASTKTSKMTITGVKPTTKQKEATDLSIKEYTKEIEKVGLKLDSDLKAKQKQKLKTKQKTQLGTKTRLQEDQKLKEKQQQLLGTKTKTKLDTRQKQKLKQRQKLKQELKLKPKTKLKTAQAQKLGLKLDLKQKLLQKQKLRQPQKLDLRQAQTTQTQTQTTGLPSLKLPARGRVKGADRGEVEGLETAEREGLPKVDVISGSLARWRVGKFKTPAGPEARREFERKSPLKGFRSAEEREKGEFSVFDTKSSSEEVNFY